ncbi:MAG TPA: DUF1585 domain-containing protein, partial [Roseimicrobium sp.]|nr:DUF1585 domain-containing protein [Roseimicrobium sp.]
GATTIREQLAKHRASESCAPCHRKIDPPGFALESFDVIGGWRENYRRLGQGGSREFEGRRVRYLPGPAVDPGDALPDGRPFKNIDEYRQLILQDKDQLARSLTEKLVAYATGAAPGKLDEQQVESIVNQVRDQQYGFRSLIHAIAQSPIFQIK